MLYLLYLRNGFIKKFPINKKNTNLGRSEANDLQIDETFVSKEHAKIVNHEDSDSIDIFDLNSTNGIFSESGKIDSARIELNEFFRIGHIKFFLKKGNIKDFAISEKIQPKLKNVFHPQLIDGEKTVEIVNHIYSEQMVEFLNIGFGQPDITQLLENSKDLLKKTLNKGTLLIVSKDHKKNIIVSKWNSSAKVEKIIEKTLNKINFFNQKISKLIESKGYYICSFPVNLNYLPSALIYFDESNNMISDFVLDFIEILSVEISIIDNLIKQNRTPQAEQQDQYQKIITKNDVLNNLIAQCKKIAKSNLSILIEGETGTGKELLAKYIHYNSSNDLKKIVALNCSAIPENLMEAELFGHEKGAFTDASMQRKGKLELASGGTLILDEIGDMPLQLQAKLLRAIQEEQFYRLGGTVPIKVKLRIISLTNKNIASLIEQNQFRNDLYYRIAHVVLKVPPLRERKEDIIPLINHFIEKYGNSITTVIKGFANETINALEAYDWPGNIRELENEFVKLFNLAENNDIIDMSMLKEEIIASYEKGGVKKGPVSDEKETILKLLEENRWNKSIVAEKMKISRTALYNKLKKYNISK